MSDPWDIQDGETAKAYQAFCAYRDLPIRERSILEAYRRSAKSRAQARQAPGHWTRWCATNGWVERARAWDAAQLAADIEARTALREAARQRVVERLEELVDKGLAIALGDAIRVIETESGMVPVHAAMVEAVMLKHMLAIAGLAELKQVEHSGPGGKPFQVQATTVTVDASQREQMAALSQDSRALEAMSVLAERAALLELGESSADQD